MHCEQCGHDNQTWANFCPHCGSRLPLVVPAARPAPVTELFCVECGQPRPSHDFFCDHCGHPFEDHAAPVTMPPIHAQATPDQQKSLTRKFALVSVTALFAIALPTAWLIYHQTTPSDSTPPSPSTASFDPDSVARQAQAKDHFTQAMTSMARQELNSADTSDLFEALTQAESATQLGPESASHWHLLGYIYSRFESDEVAAALAEDALERSTQISPGNIASRLLLAQLYLRREAYSKALDQLEWVGNKQPTLVNSALSADMCRAYILDNQVARGEKFFQGLLQAQPQSSALRLGLAILLHDTGRSQDALQQLAQLRAEPASGPQDVEHATLLEAAWRGGGS